MNPVSGWGTSVTEAVGRGPLRWSTERDPAGHYVGHGRLRLMDEDGWTDQYRNIDNPPRVVTVTVTSVGGVVGQPFADAYCGAKFAVEGFMQSLAVVAERFGVWVSVGEPAAVGL